MTNKEMTVHFWFKYHIYFMLTLMITSPLVTFLLMIQWSDYSFFISEWAFAGLAFIFTFFALVFNRIAYQYTVQAFYYFGTGVEKNPFTRKIFRTGGADLMRRIGTSVICFVSMLFAIYYYFIFGIQAFQITILLSSWMFLMIFTGLDALNDFLMTRCYQYLFVKDSGWFYMRFLPHQRK